LFKCPPFDFELFDASGLVFRAWQASLFLRGRVVATRAASFFISGLSNGSAIRQRTRRRLRG
ncbi:MAG: hypothetical protein WBZ16_05860, partial [Pseudolabrys sp.]